MKLAEHYLHLYTRLSQSSPLKPIQTNIREITNIVCCTKRHTKYLLKQLNEKRWIKWDVSPGRGKISTLTFLLNDDELQLEIAKKLVQEEKYQKALEQLETVNTEYKEQFHQWLSGQLGYKIETRNHKELDVLRYPFYKAIKHLDPVSAFSRHEVHIINHIFDTLLKYNADEHRLEPHMAHAWEASDDGEVWTFYLKKGVKFHHGREVTADDVKQTIDRIISMKEAHRDFQMFNVVKEIIVLRRTVIQFVLTDRNYLFPHFLCNHLTSIIPIEIWQKDPHGFSQHPIGTGPFKMIKHDDTMMVLESFDDYFLSRPQLDRVEILTLPELYPKQNQLINYWYNLGHHEQKENWHKIERMEQGASYLTFNLFKDGITRDKIFRKSLSLALNTNRIHEDLGFSNYSPAYSLVPGKRKSSNKHTYNLEKAKKLLEESSYQGETINLFSTQLRPGANHEVEAHWIQKQWKRVGLNCEVQVIPIEELARPTVLQKADVVIAGVALSENTILSLVKTYQLSTAFINNMVGSHLAQIIEEKMSHLKIEKAPHKQLEVFIELEDLLRSHYSIVFIRHRTHSVNVNLGSSLEGVNLNSNGRVSYKDLWYRMS